MSLVGAAAISGGSGLLSGIVNKIGQKKTEERQVKYQKELADYQYSKDVDMWSMANEYNKPGAQMERLKEAGLNPHLVYGSGSAAGNTTTPSTPKYQNPGTQFKNVPIADPQAMLSQYNQLTMNQTQQDNIKSQTSLNNIRQGTEVIRALLGEQSLNQKGELHKYNKEIKKSIVGKNLQELSNLLIKSTGMSISNDLQQGALDRYKSTGQLPGDNMFKYGTDQIQNLWNKLKEYYLKGDKGQFNFLQ